MTRRQSPYISIQDIIKHLEWLDDEREAAYGRGKQDRAGNFAPREDLENWLAIDAYEAGYSGLDLPPLHLL